MLRRTPSLVRLTAQTRSLLPRVSRLKTAAVVVIALAALAIAMPASGAQSRDYAFTEGSEPWTESDCAGKIAVVAASDPRAQPDLYSAVTLAAALGTDCVILAGLRNEPMSAAQHARLAATEDEVYVVGGTAAVPDPKLADRVVVRVSGADRWQTAHRVGRIAVNLPITAETGDDIGSEWPRRIELQGTGDIMREVMLPPGRWNLNVQVNDNRDEYGWLPITVELRGPDGSLCRRLLKDHFASSIAVGTLLRIGDTPYTQPTTWCPAGLHIIEIDTGGPLKGTGSWHIAFTER